MHVQSCCFAYKTYNCFLFFTFSSPSRRCILKSLVVVKNASVLEWGKTHRGRQRSLSFKLFNFLFMTWETSARRESQERLRNALFYGICRFEWLSVLSVVIKSVFKLQVTVLFLMHCSLFEKKFVSQGLPSPPAKKFSVWGPLTSDFLIWWCLFIIVNQAGNDSPLLFSYITTVFACSQSCFVDLDGGADYLLKISGNCNLYILQKSSYKPKKQWAKYLNEV